MQGGCGRAGGGPGRRQRARLPTHLRERRAVPPSPVCAFLVFQSGQPGWKPRAPGGYHPPQPRGEPFERVYEGMRGEDGGCHLSERQRRAEVGEGKTTVRATVVPIGAAGPTFFFFFSFAIVFGNERDATSLCVCVGDAAALVRASGLVAAATVVVGGGARWFEGRKRPRVEGGERVLARTHRIQGAPDSRPPPAPAGPHALALAHASAAPLSYTGPISVRFGPRPRSPTHTHTQRGDGRARPRARRRTRTRSRSPFPFPSRPEKRGGCPFRRANPFRRFTLPFPPASGPP